MSIKRKNKYIFLFNLKQNMKLWTYYFPAYCYQDTILRIMLFRRCCIIYNTNRKNSESLLPSHQKTFFSHKEELFLSLIHFTLCFVLTSDGIIIHGITIHSINTLSYIISGYSRHDWHSYKSGTKGQQ